jgi:CubicO group peptidase (beta-lactamase class C family)
MKKISFAIIIATFASAAMAQNEEQQVDALFAKWNKADTPGAAVEVVRDGKVLLRKGYGMADLERGVPITPSSVFNIGSTSKQFTAFSILLLAEEGKLSLDDDVRKYVPELHDFGKTITLRHLMQHTSGLRDYINVMLMVGWRIDDVATTDDALGVIFRQHDLNFEPGQEHLYSNTGYLLLAEIVKRVSGKSLAVFAKERIFDPLGMKNTRFEEKYGNLVQGRALSYVPAPGGYQYVAQSMSSYGPGGLLTTVDDLALWDRNFDQPRVGNKELIAQMQVPGVLNSGAALSYAYGLTVETYRGLKLVEHSGGLPGYRSQMTRFPEQHFTVTVLANSSALNPVALTRRIADVYLDKELAPKAAATTQVADAQPEVKLAPEKLDALLGYYALSTGFGLNFTREEGRLFGQGTAQAKFPLTAASESEFFFKEAGVRLSFDPAEEDGLVKRVVLHQGGKDLPAIRGTKPELPANAFKDLEGEYYSSELHVLYTVEQKGDKLMLSYPRGTIQLHFQGGNNFISEIPVGGVAFDCKPDAGCSGFTVTDGRVRNLKFKKVPIPGA